MDYQTPLISTIVLALVISFGLGALAHRFKVSPIAAYLLAGVILGPFTPGFVADQALANELAEIGVILLMFGVGLHFSLADLLSVRAIAVPGAIIQIVLVTLLGVALAWSLGWTPGSGVVFGIALSVASTVAVLRALQERRELNTDGGRVAVGWLIVEDLAMVLTIVLLPPLANILQGGADAVADLESLGIPLAWTVAKIAVFIGGMLVVGIRVIPWLLHYVAHTGSRELFRLAVLAIALGFAYGAAHLFSVSFALGAFLAGMVLSESQLSQRAAQESLPLRDAFAVLFFVSVGMLFDPKIIWTAPWALIATVLVIVVIKAVTGYAITRLFGQSQAVALMIGASRAQIGEFSFIVAGLGVALGVLPEQGRDLILAGAIISLLINPVLFAAQDWWPQKIAAASPTPETAPAATAEKAEPIPVTQLSGHVILIGYGRVGSVVGAALIAARTPLLVVEENAASAAPLRQAGIETIIGNSADPAVIRAVNVPGARCLLVAIPDAFEGGQAVEQARALNATVRIVARAHSEEEVAHFKRCGATEVIMGEDLIARAMIDDVRKILSPSGEQVPVEVS
jgi:CPA2 family monovalent cation:H+ antiporter-2